jgi:hypothetical protein
MYNKTNWKDRVVEFPNRYKDQDNTVHTLTGDFGTITEIGTDVTAGDLNKIETGIETLDNYIINIDASQIPVSLDTQSLYGDINVDDILNGLYKKKENIIIIDTSGTWTPPRANMLIDVFMIGGGGNGASGGSYNGGGGGGYAKTILTHRVISLTSKTVVIGSVNGVTTFDGISTLAGAGNGNSANPFNGGSGGAGGGCGGSSGGFGASGIGGNGGSGYSSGGAGKNYDGRGGYCILNDTLYGGAGGGSNNGAGGAGGGGVGGTDSTAGANGTLYGAGGGGGLTGGTGFKGCVIIAYDS